MHNEELNSSSETRLITLYLLPADTWTLRQRCYSPGLRALVFCWVPIILKVTSPAQARESCYKWNEREVGKCHTHKHKHTYTPAQERANTLPGSHAKLQRAHAALSTASLSGMHFARLRNSSWLWWKTGAHTTHSSYHAHRFPLPPKERVTGLLPGKPACFISCHTHTVTTPHPTSTAG